MDGGCRRSGGRGWRCTDADYWVLSSFVCSQQRRAGCGKAVESEEEKETEKEQEEEEENSDVIATPEASLLQCVRRHERVPEKTPPLGTLGSSIQWKCCIGAFVLHDGSVNSEWSTWSTVNSRPWTPDTPRLPKSLDGCEIRAPVSSGLKKWNFEKT